MSSREHTRAYYRRNKERAHARSNAWRLAHPLESRVIAIRHRAKELGVQFNLTADDLAGDICPVLDLPLVWNCKTADNAAEVDRVVPSLGYVKGNVRVISRRANRLKDNATLDELERLVAYMKGER